MCSTASRLNRNITEMSCQIFSNIYESLSTTYRSSEGMLIGYLAHIINIVALQYGAAEFDEDSGFNEQREY